MGQYSKSGLYSAYDRNHKEREALDYYSTPIEEVTNILEVIDRKDIKSASILEPCCGGGHMIQGILNYGANNITGTDIKDRGYVNSDLILEYGYDYLADSYPFSDYDYVIMNPPFKLIEPFVIRSLDIAKKGVLMFGRLQFLEGQARYNNILKENPPSDVYVYIDRVCCYKNGDTTGKVGSIQAYAWYYWDKTQTVVNPKLHWIWSKKHKEK